MQFEQVLGVPAQYWLNCEQHYRQHLTERDRAAGRLAELD